MAYDYDRTASDWQHAKIPRGVMLRFEEDKILGWAMDALKRERPPEAPSSGDWMGGLKPKGSQKDGEFTFEAVTFGPPETARKVHIEVSMTMGVSYGTIQVYPSGVRAKLGDLAKNVAPKKRKR